MQQSAELILTTSLVAFASNLSLRPRRCRCMAPGPGESYEPTEIGFKSEGGELNAEPFPVWFLLAISITDINPLLPTPRSQGIFFFGPG